MRAFDDSVVTVVQTRHIEALPGHNTQACKNPAVGRVFNRHSPAV